MIESCRAQNCQSLQKKRGMNKQQFTIKRLRNNESEPQKRLAKLLSIILLERS